MTDNRRRHARYAVWFPMQLTPADDEPSLAVSQNISRSGVLLATAAELQAGATVRVTFQLTGDASPRTTDARILRVRPNSEDPEGLWPFHVAIEFLDPIPDLEPLLQAVAGKGFGRGSAPPTQ